MEVWLESADGPEAARAPGTPPAAPAAAQAAAAAGVPAAVASDQPIAAVAAAAAAAGEADLAESARRGAPAAAAAGAMRAAAGALPALLEAGLVAAEAAQPQAWPGVAAGAERAAAGAPAGEAAPPGGPAEPRAAGAAQPHVRAATAVYAAADAPSDAQPAPPGMDADAGAARAARPSAWGTGAAAVHAEAAAGFAVAGAAAEPDAAQAAQPRAWAVADADAPGAALAAGAAAGQADPLQPATSSPAEPPQHAGDGVQDALTLHPGAPLAEHAAGQAVGGAAQAAAEGRDAGGAPRPDDEEGAVGAVGWGREQLEAGLQDLAAAPLASKADAAGGGARTWRLGKGLGVPDWEAWGEARHGLIGAGPPAGAERAGAAGRARALPAIRVKAADKAASAAALPAEAAAVHRAVPALEETPDALPGANEPTRAFADAPDDPSPAPPDSDLPACAGGGALAGASAPGSPCAGDGGERAAALGHRMQAAVDKPGALPEASRATHGGVAHAVQPEPEHDSHEATCAVLTPPALAADHRPLPPSPLPPPSPPPPPPPPPPQRLPGARHTSMCAPMQSAGGSGGAGRREQGRLRSATVGGSQPPIARASAAALQAPARSRMQPSPCPDRLSDRCGHAPDQPAAPLGALAGTDAADPGAAPPYLRPGSGAAAALGIDPEPDQAPADGGPGPAAGEPQRVPGCEPERAREDGQQSPRGPRFRPLHWVQAPCIAGSVWAQLGAGAPAGALPGGTLPPAAARALCMLFSSAGATSVGRSWRKHPCFAPSKLLQAGFRR